MPSEHMFIKHTFFYQTFCSRTASLSTRPYHTKLPVHYMLHLLLCLLESCFSLSNRETQPDSLIKESFINKWSTVPFTNNKAQRLPSVPQDQRRTYRTCHPAEGTPYRLTLQKSTDPPDCLQRSWACIAKS